MCPQPPADPSRGDNEEQQHRLAPPTVPDLLRTIQESPEALRVAIALDSLMPYTTTQPRVLSESVEVITAAMRRFSDHPEVQMGALEVLINLASPGVILQGTPAPALADATARAVLDAGAADLAMERIYAESSSSVVVDACCKLLSNLAGFACFYPMLGRRSNGERHADVLRAMVHALQRFPQDAAIQANACGALIAMTGGGAEGPETEKVHRSVQELGGLELAVAAMRAFPTDAHVQLSAIGVLCHCSHCTANVSKILQIGAVELVLEAMKTCLQCQSVQLNACNFIRSLCCHPSAQRVIGTAETAERVVAAMQQYPDCEHLQFKASAALWNFTAYPSTKTLALQAGAIPVAATAMTNHPRSADVQEHATGFMWNMCDTEEHRVALMEAGCIELIVKAMETHREAHGVQNEGAGALFFMAAAKDRRVRLTLTCTTNAIPALQHLFNKYNALANSMMFSGNFGGFGMAECMFLEKIGDALGRLGVMENYVIGAEEDYDPDDEVDEYPIESPPFDISNLLDKDLANDAPGWYANKGFRVSQERSHERGNTFLQYPNVPAVGQKVCIRVVLPYGGRGYVYGTVSEIAPAPTDEELAESSKIFGKGCPCPRPECPLKNGTREEILAAHGVVHGQELTAVVSLSEGAEHNDRKVRFAPLPEFFGGEKARYKMLIRYNEVECSLAVVYIEKIVDGN